MSDLLTKYIVKIEYNLQMGSGVIVNNTHFRDYFYIFTAKHIFFESNSKVIDMNSDSIIKKEIRLYNPLFDFNSQIKLEIIDIDSSYDFLIIKISNFSHEILEKCKTHIFEGKLDKNFLVQGFPAIRDRKDTKYDTYYFTFKHTCSNPKYFELDATKSLTVRAKDGNANYETSGLSGSGLFYINSREDIALVGILTNSATNQGIVCFDVREIVKEIENKLGISLPIIKEQKKQSRQLTKNLGTIKNFIGRTKELQEIKNRLDSNSFLVINGIGGIGKSSLATAFLEKSYQDYDYFGFIVALKDLKSSLFNELEGSLRLKNFDNIEKNFEEAIRGLRELEGSKLLVIDDMQDIANQKEVINTLLNLKYHGFKILFTSRQKLQNIDSLPLASLSPKDAKELFLTYHQTKEIKRVETIINHIGYHALFVELIAKTIENEGYSLDEILDKFDRGELSKIDYTDEFNGEENLLSESLNKLFELQKKEITGHYLLLLKKMATLPSIDIEYLRLEEILTYYTSPTSQKTNFWYKIFKSSKQNSYKLSKKSLKGQLNFLVARGWLIKKEDKYYLHQIIKEYILTFHSPIFREIEGVIDYFNSITKTVADFQKAVEFKEDIIYFESLDRVLEKIDKKGDNPSEFFNRFGAIYLRLGEYQKAETAFLKGLKIREELFGKQHLSTASSYNNLATVYDGLGIYDKAEIFYLKVIEIKEKMLSKNDPKKSIIYNNLAVLYEKIEAYQEAEIFYQKALILKMNHLGENHPSTATSYHNLAVLYSSMGRYKDAEPLYIRSIKIKERLLGKEHPDTAISYSGLAGFYSKVEEHEKAKEFHLKALKIQEKFLGERHPDTIHSYHKLASIHSLKEEYKEAESLFIKTLQLHREVLGEYHFHTAIVYGNFATLYEKIGDYNKSESFYLQSLTILKKIFGEKHSEIAQGYSYLAQLYDTTKKYKKSEQLYLKAIKIQDEVLEKNHPKKVFTYRYLATLYQKIEENKKAEIFFLKSLDMCQKVFEKMHIQTVVSHMVLFSFYSKTGEHNQELKHLKEVIFILEKISPNNPNLEGLKLVYKKRNEQIDEHKV